MFRLLALCFFALSLAFLPQELGAQQPTADEQEKMKEEEKRNVFINRYINPSAGRFNPRARAVVNPYPYPRPSLSPVYPDREGVSEKTFRRWEMLNHTWRSTPSENKLFLRNCGETCYSPSYGLTQVQRPSPCATNVSFASGFCL